MRVTVALIATCCVALAATTADAQRIDDYSTAVLALNPTHYFQLDETTFDTTAGSVVDYGSAAVTTARHEGVGFDGTFSPPIFGVDTEGQVGFPGGPGTPVFEDDLGPLPEPDIYIDEDYPGFSPDNRSLFGNNSVAVNLGPGTDFANTTMTVALWFKAPCSPANGNPDLGECQGPPASSGGERLFTNNLNAQDTGGETELDDLGHLQVDFGWGGNLIVSIDNRFSDPLKSNFQIPHNSGHPGPPPPGGGPGLSVKDNRWHHLVVSRDGDVLENVTLVVDGIEMTQDRWADSTDSWGTTAPFDARIGTRTTAPNDQTFNGWLDEVGIWLGRALTVQESIALYNAAIGLKALPGDFNKDDKVDGDDFLLWQANFGLAEGATQDLGDSDSDGDVDGDDFLRWQADFGTDLSGDGASAVPEPAAVSLLALAFVGLVARRVRG